MGDAALEDGDHRAITSLPTPQSGGDHGALLIIPLQRGSSIPLILASSQPSRRRACNSRDEAALPPGTLMRNKGQVFFAAVNERAWLEP